MTALRRLSPLTMALLLAITLAARLLVPSGWMPVIGADGDIRVAICSGSGPVELIVHTGSAAPAEDRRDPCPYGLSGADGLTVPPPLIALLAPAALALLVLPMLIAARLTAWRALRPPARGPPQPA